jgi:NAD(P)-dependent dehydrogenase (short-subunit alcohol dehydrogenase family)
MDNFQKVALVTGGSRGIGEAIVKRLASDGFTVYGTYNSSPEKAEAIAESLRSDGKQVHFKKWIFHQMNPSVPESRKS